MACIFLTDLSLFIKSSSFRTSSCGFILVNKYHDNLIELLVKRLKLDLIEIRTCNIAVNLNLLFFQSIQLLKLQIYRNLESLIKQRSFYYFTRIY